MQVYANSSNHSLYTCYICTQCKKSFCIKCQYSHNRQYKLSQLYPSIFTSDKLEQTPDLKTGHRKSVRDYRIILCCTGHRKTIRDYRMILCCIGHRKMQKQHQRPRVIPSQLQQRTQSKDRERRHLRSFNSNLIKQQWVGKSPPTGGVHKYHDTRKERKEGSRKVRKKKEKKMRFRTTK